MKQYLIFLWNSLTKKKKTFVLFHILYSVWFGFRLLKDNLGWVLGKKRKHHPRGVLRLIRRLKVFVMRTVAKRKSTYIKIEIVFSLQNFSKGG